MFAINKSFLDIYAHFKPETTIHSEHFLIIKWFKVIPHIILHLC